MRSGEPLTFSVEVKNAGNRDDEEVVQVYLSYLEASAPVPVINWSAPAG